LHSHCMFDTHAHLNFKDYDKDREEVIKRSLKEGVSMINIGTHLLTSKQAVEIAERYAEGVYASVGLHPIYKEDYREEDYKYLLRSQKVVAIGEIGLDKKFEHKNQLPFLRRQLALAQEHDLPVIFHCRMAHRELQREIEGLDIRGVVHSFTGSKKDARYYIDKGLYLGFNGIIFKTSLDAVIKETPLDRILIETDCPFLTPPRKRGRNEPINVRCIGERVAEVKGISKDQVFSATSQNAKNLFSI